VVIQAPRACTRLAAVRAMIFIRDVALTSAAAPPPVRCREIVEADLPALADLLFEGFGGRRKRSYWTRALDVLRTRRAAEGYPRYGYVLDAGGTLVGVVLLIFTAIDEAEARSVRCNVSSWYVREAFRPSAAFLIARALRHKEVSYINVSAAPHTWATVEAQGYRRYGEGQVTCLPALSRGPGSAAAYSPDLHRDRLPPAEAELMAAHAAVGCLCLVVEHEGRLEPFVFMRRRLRHRVPVHGLQLAWCRDTAAFVRCAGALGRRLLRRGELVVLLDAEAPPAGLVGVHERGRCPKFVRGPHTPRLNDLAYTEGALFGG